MLRESLSYPARTDEETLLVGTILVVAVGLLARLGVLAALAVVPAVLLVGYVLAVLRATAESSGGASADADAPPEFSDLRALAADGARALAVTVGYLLVPAAALAVTVGGASAGARPESLGTTTFVFGAGTVVLFVSLAFAYLLPAALVGVARTGELAAAMDRGRLRGVAGGSRYFVAWAAALLVGGVGLVLAGGLATLGRPGEVLALAVGFYAAVVVARLVGRGISG
ncbi:DUF4013 domain-containing protein [Halorussus caseinilyticus]|uniref:DUF4013 domain-containing protein n=1 Tax=Halorussus caseinilyticus TaxID=3034025 RepID=UPI0023E8EA25|nr:DUF4013 domain-containing protein [Halorussus sp. DT72]